MNGLGLIVDVRAIARGQERAHPVNDLLFFQLDEEREDEDHDQVHEEIDDRPRDAVREAQRALRGRGEILSNALEGIREAVDREVLEHVLRQGRQAHVHFDREERKGNPGIREEEVGLLADEEGELLELLRDDRNERDQEEEDQKERDEVLNQNPDAARNARAMHRLHAGVNDRGDEERQDHQDNFVLDEIEDEDAECDAEHRERRFHDAPDGQMYQHFFAFQRERQRLVLLSSRLPRAAPGSAQEVLRLDRK